MFFLAYLQIILSIGDDQDSICVYDMHMCVRCLLLCLRPEYRLDLSLIILIYWPLPNRINQPPHTCDREASFSQFLWEWNWRKWNETTQRSFSLSFPNPWSGEIKLCGDIFYTYNAAYHWNEETCGSPLTATQVAQFEPRSIKCSATRVALLYSNCSHLYNSANSVLTTPSFRFSHCCMRLEVRDTSSSEPQVSCDDLLGQNWSE